MPATKRIALPLILAACMGLTACGSVKNDPDRTFNLRKITNKSNGPDEFTIVPGKPLESPPSFVELPQPTPGGENRTDQHPMQDAVAALGGNPGNLVDRGVGGGDGALVSAASRRGVDPTIRTTLAEEDKDFRYRKWVFSRLRIFGSDEYYRSYENQALDRRATQERWRRAGAPTPSSPPER